MCYNLNIMKRIKYLLTLITLFTLISPSFALDETNEEFFDTQFPDEITLNDSIIEDVQAIKFFRKDEDVESDDANDNAEMDFEFFRMFDKDNDDVIDEDTLLGKIIHSKITRTDVPSFLLQNELTKKFEHGPISKIQGFATYSGSLSAIWKGADYSTEYNNAITQIGIMGAFRNPNYKFQLRFNPIPKGGTNYLDRVFSDAFILNSSIPNHQIVVGYSRIQTGVEGGKSAYILPFATRSQIARNFGNSRSLAIKVIGNYQYVDYIISGGSSGRTLIGGMPGAEFTGWINFKPLGNKLSEKYGKVTIGAGLNSGHRGFSYNVANGYIGYHHKKLWTNFEASIADGYNGNAGRSQNKASGWAYTLGWKFNPHIQLLGRIDQFDPNRHVSHDLKREYTLGLNWFIKGQALKFVLNYVFCDNQNTKDSHKIILATQIML